MNTKTQRLKKMPEGIRKDLERAAEMIATEKCIGICESKPLASNRKWINTEEAKIIKPDEYGSYWWGFLSMRESYYTDSCIAARLMGIAIMLTMPEEIINHECCK